MTDESIDKFFASAVKLEQGETPEIVTSGHGDLGRLIVSEARNNGVPVLQDFALSKELAAVSSGESIPEELFAALSVVLALILEMESESANEKSESHSH